MATETFPLCYDSFRPPSYRDRRCSCENIPTSACSSRTFGKTSPSEKDNAVKEPRKCFALQALPFLFSSQKISALTAKAFSDTLPSRKNINTDLTVLHKAKPKSTRKTICKILKTVQLHPFFSSEKSITMSAKKKGGAPCKSLS